LRRVAALMQTGKALVHALFANVFAQRSSSSPWDDKSPVREELFGIERLEQHAESLAAA